MKANIQQSKTFVFVFATPKVEGLSFKFSLCNKEETVFKEFQALDLEDNVETDTIKTYYMTFQMEETTIKLSLSNQHEKYYSYPIKLNQSQFQFVYDFKVALPNGLSSSAIHLKTQMESMELCAKELFKEEGLEALYSDSINYLAIKSKPKDFEFFLSLFANKHSLEKTKALECFSLSHYSSLPHLHNIEEYQELMQSFAESLSKNTIDTSLKTAANSLLALFYFNYHNEKFIPFTLKLSQSDRDELLQAIVAHPKGFIGLPIDLIEKLLITAPEPRILNSVLSMIPTGNLLIETIYKHIALMEKAYTKAPLIISQLLNCSKDDLLNDFIQVSKHYFSFMSKERHLYPFMVFNHLIFFKYISYAYKTDNEQVITHSIEQVVPQLKEVNHYISDLILHKCEDSLEALRLKVSRQSIQTLEYLLPRNRSKAFLLYDEYKKTKEKDSKLKVTQYEQLSFINESANDPQDSSRKETEVSSDAFIEPQQQEQTQEEVISSTNSSDCNELISKLYSLNKIDQNKQIIDFFKNNTFNEKKNNYLLSYFELAKQIDFEIVKSDNALFNSFCSIANFSGIFSSYHLSFLKELCKTIRTLSSFLSYINILIKLNSFQSIIKELQKLFVKLVNEQPSHDIPQLITCITIFIKQLNSSDSLCLFRSIEEVIVNRDTLFSLYDLLQYDYLKDSRYIQLKGYINEYFSKQIPLLSVEEICNYLLTLKLYQRSILNVSSPAIIIEIKNFFLNDSNSYLLLKRLVSADFFESNLKFKEMTYFKKTKQSIDSIKTEIEKDRITFEQCALIEERCESVKEKVDVLFKEKIEGNRFLAMIKEKCSEALDILKNSQNEIEYHQIFFKSDQTGIKKMKELHQALLKTQLSDIRQGKYKAEIEQLSKSKENTAKNLKLYSIDFFRRLYCESSSSNSEADRLQRAIEDFNALETIFRKGQIANLVYEWLKNIKSKEELSFNISEAKAYFNITENTDELEAKLNKALSNIVLKYHVNSIVFFFKVLKKDEPKLISELVKYQVGDILTLNEADKGKLTEKLRENNLFDIKADDRSFRLLALIEKQFDLVELLEGLNDHKMFLLKELVNSSGHLYINFDIVFNLLPIYGLVKEVREIDNSQMFRQQLSSFKNLLMKKEYIDIEDKFLKMIGQSQKIQLLMNSLLNKMEDSNITQSVKDILQDTAFQLKKDSHRFYYEIVSDSTGKVKYFSDMLVIYKKALIALNKSILNDSKEDDSLKVKDFAKFCSFIHMMNEYLSIVNKLKGKYALEPIVNVVFLKAELSVTYETHKKDKRPIREEKNYLQSVYSEIEAKIIKGYQSYPFLSFQKGAKYLEIPYVITSKILRKEEDYHCLNLEDSEFITKEDIEIKADEPISTTVTSIDKVISTISEKYKLEDNQIYFNNFIKKQHSNVHGIYVKHFPSPIEADFINLYRYFTGNLPMPFTVLLCDRRTNEDEVSAFIFKSLRCSFNVLFALFQVNNLRFEVKKQVKAMISLLNEKGQKSTLMIVSSSDSCDLCVELKQMKRIKQIETREMEKDYGEWYSKVEVISSDLPGIGKTRHIKDEAKKDNADYVYFPIGGSFTQEEIITRLQSLQFDEKSAVLHLDLDLSHIKDTTLMTNFLFSFLFMKWYRWNNLIFYLGENVKIKVETPDSTKIEKYSFMKLFESTTISSSNKPMIIVAEEVNSKAQIVCNYLKAKKQNTINSYSFYIRGLGDYRLPRSRVEKDMKLFYLKGNSLLRAECHQLLNEHFKGKNFTYYQINAFLNYLKRQLKIFTLNPRFNAITLGKHDSLKSIRLTVFLLLIKTAEYFTLRASDSSGEPLLKPSFLLLNDDNKSYNIVRPTQDISEQTKELELLYNMEYILGISTTKLELIQQEESSFEYLKQLRILSNNQSKESRSNSAGMSPCYRDNDPNLFVITKSKYHLMIEIVMKIKAKIPIVLIGEAGSGKTALIHKIAEIMNLKMLHMEMYSFTTDNDITHFMNDEVLLKRQEKLLVLFDNINTGTSLWLINEILCKRTIKGQPIRNSILFIAACCPTKMIRHQSALGNHLNKNNFYLAYNTRQLPTSLLNFSSKLDNDDGPVVIYLLASALKDIFSPMAKNFQSKTFIDVLLSKTSKWVVESQSYVRNTIDDSFVSIRDIKRFIKLLKWFLTVNASTKLVFNSKTTTKEIEPVYFKGMILSLYICYYLKFNLVDRKNLNESLNKKDLNHINTEVIKEELMRFGQLFELPKGVVLNNPMLECLYASFVCISNRIPLFLVGQSGYSKSLSVNILVNAMRGKNSSNKAFIDSPQIYVNWFQGSPRSRNEEVNQLFDNAQLVVGPSVISLIYFDELGQAEMGNCNIHPRLEAIIDEEAPESKVAFIGTSQWVLDSALMEKGVFVSIPELTENDYSDTLKQIGKSYGIELPSLMQEDIDKLLKAHNAFMTNMKANNRNTKYENIHSLRDYYHLINRIYQRIEYSQMSIVQQMTSVCLESIERNFDGFADALTQFKTYFQRYRPSGEVKDLVNHQQIKHIQSNLGEQTSRFLLIILKSSLNTFVTKHVLSNGKNIATVTGSQLDEDVNSDYYQLKLLNKVQFLMNEPNQLVIFKNADTIYSFLNELFDQNYIVFNDKKYVRITQGVKSCYKHIDDNFRCAILINQFEMSQRNSSFLNKFEKHYMTFETLFKPEERQEIVKFNCTIQSIIAFEQDIQAKLTIDLASQLVNCYIEEFYAIIYKLKQENKQIHSITKELLKVVVPTLSQDIIIFSSYSNLSKENKAMHKEILDLYKAKEHRTLQSFIQAIDNTHNVVYTFSNPLEEIALGAISNAMLGDITTEAVEERYITSFKTENEILLFLQEFYTNESKTLCLLKFRECDCIHLSHTVLLIEEIEKLYLKGSKTKGVILIIYLKRQPIAIQQHVLKDQPSISHTNNYYGIFIDNLNNSILKEDIFTFIDALKLTNEELFTKTVLINLKEEFNGLFLQAKEEVYYKAYNKKPIKQIDRFFAQDNIIDRMLFIILRNIKAKEQHSFHQLLFTNLITNSIPDLFSKMKTHMRQTVIDIFINVLLQMLKEGAIVVIDEEFPPETKQGIKATFDHYFDDINSKNMDYPQRERDYSLLFIDNLKIPLLLSAYDSVNSTMTNWIREYYIIENRKLDNKRQKMKQEGLEQLSKQKLFETFKRQKAISGNMISIITEDYLKIFLAKYLNRTNEDLPILIKDINDNCMSTLLYTDLLEIFLNQILFFESNHELLAILLNAFCSLQELNPFFSLASIASIYSFNKINLKPNDILDRVLANFIARALEEIKKAVNDKDNTHCDIKEIIMSFIRINEINPLPQVSEEIKLLSMIHSSFESLTLSEEYKLTKIKTMYTLMFSSGANRLRSLYDFYQENVEQFNQLSQLLLFKLIKEYHDNSIDNIIKLSILDIYFSNDYLLRNGSQLLECYFSSIPIVPCEGIEEQFSKLFTQFPTGLREINDNTFSNPVFDELMLAFFEKRVVRYFNKIQCESHCDSSQAENKPITSEKRRMKELEDKFNGKYSLSFFNDCVKYIITKQDENKKKKEHLKQLYAISYIKLYLFYLVQYHFLTTGKNCDLDHILKTIMNQGGNQELKRILHFYYLKLCLREVKTYHVFAKINFSTQQLDHFVQSILMEKADSKEGEEEYPYDYLFLDISKEEEDYFKMYEYIKAKRSLQSIGLKKQNFSLFIDCVIRFLCCRFFGKSNEIDEAKSYLANCIELFLSSLPSNQNNKVFQEILQIFISEDRKTIETLFNKAEVLLEMILYLYKFVVIMILNNDNKPINTIIGMVMDRNKVLMNQMKDNYNDESFTVKGYDAISLRVILLGVLSLQMFFKIIGILGNVNLNEVFNLIIVNWNVLASLLREKQIDSIQIFFSLLLTSQNPISLGMFNQKELSRQFIDYVNKTIDNYPELKEEFKSKNYSFLGRTPMDPRTILCELEDPTSSAYPEESYPLLKYFMVTKYPNEDDVRELMKVKANQRKHPFIQAFIAHKEKLELLMKVPIINKVGNRLLEKYSNSKMRKTMEGLPFPKTEQDDKNFIAVIRAVLPLIGINLDEIAVSKKPLSFFINEKDAAKEEAPLAYIYQYLITLNNEIVKPIFEQKGAQYSQITERCSLPIPIQSVDQWLSFNFKECFKSLECFDDLVNLMANRNCLGNGEVNFSNYQVLNFNLDKIEEEMTQRFLPHLRLFNTELTYIDYLDKDKEIEVEKVKEKVKESKIESISIKKSSVIIDFIQQIPQKKLSEDKRKTLRAQFKRLKKQWKYSEFKSLLQEILKSNSPLSSLTLKSFPKQIPKEILESISKQKEYIALDVIVHVFEIFEEAFFSIKENEGKLTQNRKGGLSDELKTNAKEYFNSNSHFKPKVMQLIINLILRSEELKLAPEENAFMVIRNNPDLWDFDSDEVDDKMLADLENLKVPVKSCYSLHMLLSK